tara:strand:- start:12300 stop:12548 length:249 start_codon:yes stop_codon:yes gene_type:complete
MAIRLSKSKIIATIVYKTPELPHIIQEFNYEGFDIPPEYPYFDLFMEYWNKNIPSIILDVRGVCKDSLIEKYVQLHDTLTVH